MFTTSAAISTSRLRRSNESRFRLRSSFVCVAFMAASVSFCRANDASNNRVAPYTVATVTAIKTAPKRPAMQTKTAFAISSTIHWIRFGTRKYTGTSTARNRRNAHEGNSISRPAPRSL